MKPFTASEPFVGIPAHVAAELAPYLAEVRALARRDAATLTDDALDALDRIVTLADAWRDRIPPRVPTVDRPCSVPVQWITTKEAADETGVSDRAVRGLLDRGSLHGEQNGRTWRVCAADAAARREGRRCEHQTR